MKAETVVLVLPLAILLVVIAGSVVVAVILDNAEADSLSVSSVDINTAEETANSPIGHEAIFAVSGLFAVAYLVSRQRDG